MTISLTRGRSVFPCLHYPEQASCQTLTTGQTENLLVICVICDIPDHFYQALMELLARFKVWLPVWYSVNPKIIKAYETRNLVRAFA